MSREMHYPLSTHFSGSPSFVPTFGSCINGQVSHQRCMSLRFSVCRGLRAVLFAWLVLVSGVLQHVLQAPWPSDGRRAAEDANAGEALLADEVALKAPCPPFVAVVVRGKLDFRDSHEAFPGSSLKSSQCHHKLYIVEGFHQPKPGGDSSRSLRLSCARWQNPGRAT